MARTPAQSAQVLHLLLAVMWLVQVSGARFWWGIEWSIIGSLMLGASWAAAVAGMFAARPMLSRPAAVVGVACAAGATIWAIIGGSPRWDGAELQLIGFLGLQALAAAVTMATPSASPFPVLPDTQR